MKKIILSIVLTVLSVQATAFEIFALGTSNTNCRGVDRTKTFTVHLEELLHADGIDAKVINAGLDGDIPAWMMVRLSAGLNDNTRLVIFEPGPNDKNKSSSVENSEKILSFLHERQMPTIYISHSAIQTVEEGLQTATKFGAYYYGDWIKDVPVDRVHRQYDKGTGGGHMTAEGCQLWAKNTLPLVKQIIVKKNIK